MESNENDCSNVKWNGWGYADSMFIVKDEELYFTGNRYALGTGGEVEQLTFFKDWAIEVLNVNLQDHVNTPVEFPMPTSYPESCIPVEFLKEIEELGIKHSTKGEDRLKRSHGQTLHEIFTLRMNKLPKLPDVVLWPKNHEQVCEITNLAVKYNLVIIPFGGCTSVSGASSCPSHETRPIIALDTSHMNQLLWLNEENLTACFQTGITGQQIERILRAKGFTCGHEPDSYEFSSLGGWVATRASGMKKNIYGNIEDILVGFRMVTPKGVLEKRYDIPRVSCGPDFTHLVLGSEGTLGVITEVTVKIRPNPAFKKYNSFVFKDFKSGVQCMREIARQRCQPASVRFMDNEQFKFGQALRHRVGLLGGVKDALKRFYLCTVKNFEMDSICVMTVLFEGQLLDDINNHLKKISQIAKSFGGLCAGEKNGKLGYNLTFVIAYIRDLALSFKVVAESFETSVPWDKTMDLCNNVKNCVRKTCKDLSIEHFFISCRITQTYDTGCCVYFYLAFNWVDQDDPVTTFEHLETIARQEILNSGGSLSHHHGIGKIRSKFYTSQVSNYGADLYRVVKQYVDPQNIFGVGNILSRL